MSVSTPLAHYCPRLAKGAEPKRWRFVFFLVLLDALVYFVRELQLTVDAASVLVIEVRANVVILRRLPLQDPIPLGRTAALLLDVLHHRPNVPFVRVLVLRQKPHELFVVHEVRCNHDREPAVVADVLAPSQGLQHVVRYRALLGIFKGINWAAFGSLV